MQKRKEKVAHSIWANSQRFEQTANWTEATSSAEATNTKSAIYSQSLTK